MTGDRSVPSVGRDRSNRPEEPTMSTDTLKRSARSEIQGFKGQFTSPEDPSYEEARAVYNGMIDRRPALIARAADPQDVPAVVSFAGAHDLVLAVRGGAHNGAGLGTVDDGIVLDLAGLKSIDVHPGARTVRVGGGCTWGEVDAATGEYGLACPSGIISTTGVGGLTLGGGLGHLTRRYGLSIDNLNAAELVLADGSRVRASATERPDLFWALRGGGGNFGVVTSFEFRANPLPATVQAGPTFWPMEQLPQVMRFSRESLPAAPRSTNGFFATMTVPPSPMFPEELHMRKVCAVMWYLIGESDAAAVSAAVHGVGTPLLHGVG